MEKTVGQKKYEGKIHVQAWLPIETLNALVAIKDTMTDPVYGRPSQTSVINMAILEWVKNHSPQP